MQGLHDLFEQFSELWGLILGIAGVIIVMQLYVPPIRLVWRCLSVNERWPLRNTLIACWASKWPFNPASFGKQMRLWLELRLLCPEPVREPRWRLNAKSKRFQLGYDNQAYEDERELWRREVSGKFAELQLRDSEPIIEVRDVFSLNDESTKSGIKEYLLAVSDLKLSLSEQASFLCKVRINEGFLVPLNLLAGLMSRFASDWDPIITSYGRAAARSSAPGQMAIFNLWLLWGPSVPICNCDQWSGPVTLQYGFGDENNSIRVRVEGAGKQALLDELRQAVERRGSTSYPALHASLTGKLWPPSSFVQGQFCGAQQELLNPDREAFILEYDSHSVIGNPSGSQLFYTAYVWIMFVVGREEKPTVDSLQGRPWSQVIPFFEHANIVNETTYEMAKLQLAQKVLSYVKNAARFETDSGRGPLRLWYVSAIDDSGCGDKLEVPPKGDTIRSVIDRLLDESQHRDLRESIITHHDDSYAELVSGCHLSELVSEFFDTVDAGAAGRTSPAKEAKVVYG